jgi:cytochrome c2
MKRALLLTVAVIVAIMVCRPLFAQDKAAEGKKVFEREKCSMCHTATRNSLADVGSKLTADQIREWLVNPKAAAAAAKVTPKPMMRSFEKLSKEDQDALVAYVQTMKAPKK